MVTLPCRLFLRPSFLLEAGPARDAPKMRNGPMTLWSIRVLSPWVC